MPISILNPIIQSHTTDTLGFCSDSLAYLRESIGKLELEEVPNQAQRGLQTILDCISHAIDFETIRTCSDTDIAAPDVMNDFEISLLKEICAKIAKDGEDLIIMPNPVPRKDN